MSFQPSLSLINLGLIVERPVAFWYIPWTHLFGGSSGLHVGGANQYICGDIWIILVYTADLDGSRCLSPRYIFLPSRTGLICMVLSYLVLFLSGFPSMSMNVSAASSTQACPEILSSNFRCHYTFSRRHRKVAAPHLSKPLLISFRTLIPIMSVLVTSVSGFENLVGMCLVRTAGSKVFLIWVGDEVRPVSWTKLRLLILLQVIVILSHSCSLTISVLVASISGLESLLGGCVPYSDGGVQGLR